MKINTEFETAFVMQRKSHLEQCMLMSQYIYTYKQLHDSMNTYFEQMNLASSFFQLTFRAIRTSMILWIAKAFDIRESSSIYSFLSFIRQNIRYLSIEFKMYRTNALQSTHWIKESPIIIESLIDEQINSLNSILPIVQKIITLRDKYHAHLDRSVINNRQSFVKDNNFTWEEIDIFPLKYHEIINFYSIAFNGEGHFYPVPINWNDLEELLKPLHEIGIPKTIT